MENEQLLKKERESAHLPLKKYSIVIRIINEFNIYEYSYTKINFFKKNRHLSFNLITILNFNI